MNKVAKLTFVTQVHSIPDSPSITGTSTDSLNKPGRAAKSSHERITITQSLYNQIFLLIIKLI